MHDFKGNEWQPCPLCNNMARDYAAPPSGHYYRCPGCDLIAQASSELPSHSAELAHYDTHENSPDDPGYRNFLGRLAEPLFRQLPPGAHGLDYGCGPGPSLSVMAQEAGFSMQDYDPFFADHAELLEQQYDFITCTEAVEHFYAPHREFEQLNAMLRPGGLLGLMTELHDTTDDFAGWWYHRDPTHVVFLSSLTLDWLAGTFNWEPVCRERAVSIFRKHPA
jgi:SAM-dependent methyltransferase